MKSWNINLSKSIFLAAVFSLSALCAAAGPLTAFGEQRDTIDAAELLPSFDTLQVQPDTVEAPDAEPTSFYARRTQRLKRDWARLAPNQHTLQFAGSIGMFSIGTGWHYGRRNQLETEILFGYLPNCNGSEHHYTLTIKQRYIPWHIPLSVRSQRWELEPLTCGGFANTIFGEGFWRHEHRNIPRDIMVSTPNCVITSSLDSASNTIYLGATAVSTKASRPITN